MGSLAQRLMPFLVFPILSRRLGHDAFGVYITAVAVSGIVSQVVEFGYNLTATRKVAELASYDPKSIPGVMGEVLGGRVVIASAFVLILAIVRAFYSIALADEYLFWSCVALGIAIGTDFRFMFYGRQSVGYITFYAIAYAVLSAGSIILLVNRVEDLWLAFAVPAIIAFTFAGLSLKLLRARVNDFMPKWTSVAAGLRDSWPAFVQRGLVQINSNINPIILGAFVPSAAVGYFGLAERLLRQAALFAINPAQSTLVPHIASTQTNDPSRARRDFVAVWWGLILAALAGGCIVFVSAPLICWVFLGESPAAAVLPLRILSLSPALLVLNQFGFSLWLYLIGRQRDNNVIMLAYVFASICSVALASAFFGHVGASGALICMQIILGFAYTAYCHVNEVAPWQMQLRPVVDDIGRKDFGTKKSRINASD